MFDMTVDEARKVLGVSRERIYQLIQSGTLDAEKIGRSWLIDGSSVRLREQANVRPGRPPRHDRAASERYMLMNREHEVLSFRFDLSTGEFFDADELIDVARAPFGVISRGSRGTKASKTDLSAWWGHRTIPKGRTGIESKLAELGIAQPYELPFRCLGLSLSDQYWVRPYGKEIKWADINFFENSFCEVEVEDWLADVGLDSPDNTSDGVLSKRWIERGNRRVLLKGGRQYNQEPFNEVVATELFARLLDDGDYVSYKLEELDGAPVSACPVFLAASEEFIPALYVKEGLKAPEPLDDYHGFVYRCAELDIDGVETALSKMIVCDYILANTDRHWRNFGVLRDVETLEYRMAPLFDTGTSLWCGILAQDMGHSSFHFASKPFDVDAKSQLRLVKDVSWLDPNKLTGFPERAAEILDENPAMEGRVDFIFEGIQRNVDYVRTVFF